jgi:hypothetical protein
MECAVTLFTHGDRRGLRDREYAVCLWGRVLTWKQAE